MRAPFGSHFARLYALAAPALALIAVYRAALCLFPPGAWALSLSLALFGLAAPLVLGGRLRDRLLTGRLPLALAVPVIGLLASPRIVPSPLTVGPFMFCAGALAGACAVSWLNVWHRRRRLERVLDDGDAERARAAESFVNAYFAAAAWADRATEKRSAAARARQVQIPAELVMLRHLAEACARAPERAQSAHLVAPSLDSERDWITAIDFLARRHGIACPDAFRAYRRALARAPLTPRDVAPLEGFRPALAKPLAAGLAVIVFASVLLSTATAQPPIDDARSLPVMTGSRGVSHVEPRLSDVLTSLAGHRVEARCWSRADWQRLSRQRSRWPRHDRPLGRWSAYAAPAHDEAHFSMTLCAALSRVVYGRVPVRRDEWPAALAFSVGTLAHEAQHLRGILNEAKAECFGMQSMTRAAVLLGRSRDGGRYLAALYWRYDYNDERRDRAYFSDECRNGGRLDLNPSTGAWP